MATSVAKVLVDTKQHDFMLQKSIDKWKDFGKQNMTVTGILSQSIGALGKVAAGFGALSVAGAAWNSVMSGSQTLGDAFNNSLTAVKGSLSALATNIATMDFSNMLDGFDAMIKRSKEAADALDAYFNVMLSGGVITARLQTEFKDATTVMRDNNATPEEKAAAKGRAEDALRQIEEADREKNRATIETLQAVIAAKSGLNKNLISEDMIRQALEVQGTAGGQERLELARQRHDAWERQRPSKVEHKVSGGGMYAMGYELPNEHYAEDLAEHMSLSYERFADEVIYALNERMSDDELQDVANKLSTLDNSRRSTLELRQNLNEASNAVASAGAKTGSTPKVKTYSSGMEIADLKADPWAIRTASMKQLNAELARYKEGVQRASSLEDLNAAERGIEETKKKMEAQPIALRAGVSLDSVVELQTGMETIMEQVRSEMKPLTIPIKADGVAKQGKAASDAWELALQSVSQLGGALGSLDNKGLNIAGTVMQAVANVALGFAEASRNSAATGVFGWIAASVAGLATMISTIATIKSQTSGSFAEGGVVPGSYNGGIDSTYVYASPGEVILNRAQQQNLLGQLEGGERGGGEAYVRGETMFMAINNYMRRTGRRFV